jgi:hypothetical protein
MSPIVWSSTPGEAIAAWNPPPSALPLKSVKLKEHVVTDSAGEYSRTVWISTRPSVASSRLYLFLDAEYYLQRMDTLAVMTDLQASGSIPPGICLFVSHRDHAARHDDYTCNPRYAGSSRRMSSAGLKFRNLKSPTAATSFAASASAASPRFI